LNGNNTIADEHSQGTTKAAPRGKKIALNTFIRKENK
jgi:hypothetical protein